MDEKYTIMVRFKTWCRSKVVIDAVSHSVIDPALFSIVAYDQKRYLIPLTSIAYIEFDERLDKILKAGAEKRV